MIHKIKDFIERDESYYCSFGTDSKGNEISGVIRSLTYEAFCNSGGYTICDCQMISESLVAKLGQE